MRQDEREAVQVFREATKCSERRACGLMEIVRAMVRYLLRPRWVLQILPIVGIGLACTLGSAQT
jgi:hypothetical protein